MFIVNKSQEMKVEFLAITSTDRLVGSPLAQGKNKQNMDNEGLIAEIQKEQAIWDPKDALYYFCILYIIFYILHYLNIPFDIQCIGFFAFIQTAY